MGMEKNIYNINHVKYLAQLINISLYYIIVFLVSDYRCG